MTMSTSDGDYLQLDGPYARLPKCNKKKSLLQRQKKIVYAVNMFTNNKTVTEIINQFLYLDVSLEVRVKDNDLGPNDGGPNDMSLLLGLRLLVARKKKQIS